MKTTDDIGASASIAFKESLSNPYYVISFFYSTLLERQSF